MEDKIVYLFAAYTIIWAAVLFYAFSLSRRQRDLQREIEALREAGMARAEKMAVNS